MALGRHAGCDRGVPVVENIVGYILFFPIKTGNGEGEKSAVVSGGGSVIPFLTDSSISFTGLTLPDYRFP